MNLRMGGHFIRMLLAVDKLLENLQIVRGPPPPGAAEEAAQIVDLMMADYAMRHGSPDTPAKLKAQRAFAAAWKQFFLIFNGRPSLDGLVTYQEAPVSRADILKAAKTAIMTCLLPHLPPVASINKWMKFLPSNTFWTAGTYFKIFRILCKLAFATLEFELKKKVSHLTAKQNQADQNNLDPEVAAQVLWHQISGKRFLRLVGVLNDDFQIFSMTVIMVILEPHEVVAHIFSMYSHVQPDHSKCSPVLDLLNPRFSVITHALQYFATLLDGSAPRLQLIWRRAGCTSFEDWHQLHPDQVQYTRRLILLLIGQYQQRHVKQLRRFQIYSLADPRLPRCRKLEIAQIIKQKDLITCLVGVISVFF